VYGQEGHAGTVAMSERDDALVAAASIVVSISKRARMHRAFATVGTLEVKNSSVNKIPGEVAFSIDMRHPDEAVLNDLEAELTAEMHQMEATNPKLQFHSERLWHFPASAFDTDVLSCLRSSATEVVGLRSTMEMRSFAGHDSGLTATVVPTAMLFVPSIDGISHAPEEWTSKEDW
jgi:N-carbamoyl-L-amino-acid hydrolase